MAAGMITVKKVVKKQNVPNFRRGLESRVRPTLLMGIDLGTSRTAVVTSNGHRREFSSYVGVPKDEISKKVFGNRLLFGEEAQANRISLELFRPLEKGVIKANGNAQENIDAVNHLLQHAVSLAGSTEEDTVYAVIGAPSRASIKNMNDIIEASRGVLDGVLIASEPFTVAYGLDILTDALILDIGAGTMDLCRMHGTFPSKEDQITIEKAGDYIDETLFKLLQQTYPDAQFSLNMVKCIKEKYGYVDGDTGPIEMEFTVGGRPKAFDITEQLKGACRSALPSLIEAVYSLIGTCDPEFQTRLRNNLIVCGGGSQMEGLKNLIEEGLEELGGGRVVVVDDPVFAGAYGALKMASEVSDEQWVKLT